jgi:hypothetical protein
LKETLPRNLADNPGPLSKFILLDYNSQDGLVEYAKSAHIEALISGKLVVYSFPEPAVFHMTHAKNMAHRCGMREGANILCNLDADNLTGPAFDGWIAKRFDERDDIFLWARMFTQANGRRPRGISGRIVVRDKAFLRVGGYDEKFSTWGHDDKDFHYRLGLAGFGGVEIEPQYLDTILHTDRLRFREYPQAARNDTEVANEAIDSPAGPIANFGKVGCGTVFRNFSATPVVLAPIPTRIFGVGMHKTGTTSLHIALRMLGFESAHWKNAHWARAIWEEVTGYGKSRRVEFGYALSDLPIAALYRELDRNYPGSKFILTVRNEGAWLKSVENHWSSQFNPFRGQWDTDPFTHQIHKAIYGQKNFDALRFLARFRRHNREVTKYFKDRPGDLLTMDMSNGSGWPELCAFLDRPIPAAVYPKMLVTPENNPNL